MKTFDLDGKKFTLAKPSLAVEDLWSRFAFDEDGNYNKQAISQFSRDSAAVNEFMRLMTKGDHEGVDWFREPSEIVSEVFESFFTPWSARLTKALDTLSTSLAQNNSLTLEEGKEQSAVTATE